MSGGYPGVEDVVGDRVLVGVQSVRISRLSTHPVPLVAGALIAVAGQGPKDSNGAGKSSLIAQISLLQADEQWRFGSGAQAAVDLLFNAEDAGGEERWGSADHGYVIGVFTDRAATDLATLRERALTVWLRIDRGSQRGPRLKLRWHDGLHLPAGASEAEREASADALWGRLAPRGAGRQDLPVRDLPAVLYGGHVRCLSFLSTSVRASHTPNLLAQPLGDIPEHRIFAAIAALTGIDHELEQERQARRHEHDSNAQVAAAAADLAGWEESTASVEAGIDARDSARAHLAAAAEAWRSRTARLLHDAGLRDEAIGAELAALDRDTAAHDDRVRELTAQLRELDDDEAFGARLLEAQREAAAAAEADRALGNEQAVLTRQLEELDRSHRQAAEAGREADGRDQRRADAERERADRALEETTKAVGVAEQAVASAADRLRAAESGQDLAKPQLDLLAAAGIPASCLFESLTVPEAARAAWEPLLWPYRDAAVVDADHLPAAVAALAAAPGSILVSANDTTANHGTANHGTANDTTDDGAPAAPGPDLAGFLADPGVDVTGFLAGLAARAACGHARDGAPAAGTAVVVVGGFDEPVTGRASRIERAVRELADAEQRREAAEAAMTAARAAVRAAARRQAGARSARAAAGHASAMAQLREQLTTVAEQRTTVRPILDAANQARDAVLRASATRQAQGDALRAARTTAGAARAALAARREALLGERSRLELADHAARWGGQPAEADRHLADLPDAQRQWSEDDWWQEARRHLAASVTACFPSAPPHGDGERGMPSEVAVLASEFDQRGPGGARRAQAAFPAMLHAMHVHLRQQEGYDRHSRQQIATQRAERRGSLDVARQGHEEAVEASRAFRGTLTEAIKKKLAAVDAEFDRLDRAYGGYGAGLDFTEPQPPTDPTEPWAWRVTPVWRRAEGRRMVPYNRRANTAQMDDRAIKLVCAAAMASGTGRPLMLILDELGRNLGRQHRREAVALLGQIGRDSGITVVGALQDDMEPYAIDACGEYVKLRRASDANPYNDPPVIIGYDRHGGRVELLREWLTGEPAPQQAPQPESQPAPGH